ncbi:MAG: type II toxin-antitoxin system HicA family toxin [Candidatus Paceibacterota bacterium]
MSRAKPISYEVLTKKLQRGGYVPIRKTKHTIYFNPTKEVTVPIPHKHQSDVPKGLLHKIIKEMKLSVEEFNEL